MKTIFHLTLILSQNLVNQIYVVLLIYQKKLKIHLYIISTLDIILSKEMKIVHNQNTLYVK